MSNNLMWNNEEEYRELIIDILEHCIISQDDFKEYRKNLKPLEEGQLPDEYNEYNQIRI